MKKWPVITALVAGSIALLVGSNASAQLQPVWGIYSGSGTCGDTGYTIGLTIEDSSYRDREPAYRKDSPARATGN